MLAVWYAREMLAHWQALLAGFHACMASMHGKQMLHEHARSMCMHAQQCASMLNARVPLPARRPLTHPATGMDAPAAQQFRAPTAPTDNRPATPPPRCRRGGGSRECGPGGPTRSSSAPPANACHWCHPQMQGSFNGKGKRAALEQVRALSAQGKEGSVGAQASKHAGDQTPSRRPGLRTRVGQNNMRRACAGEARRGKSGMRRELAKRPARAAPAAPAP